MEAGDVSTTRRVNGWLDGEEEHVERRANGWLDEDEEEAIMGGVSAQGGAAAEWQPEEWEEDMARAYGEYAEEGTPLDDG